MLHKDEICTHDTSDTDGFTSFYIEILVNSGHEKSLLPSSHTGYVDQLLTALGAIDQLRQEYRFFSNQLCHTTLQAKNDLVRLDRSKLAFQSYQQLGANRPLNELFSRFSMKL